MTNVTTVQPQSTLPIATVISTTLDGSGAHMSNVVIKDSDITPITITRADNFLNDAFQRQRVSAPDTRFDVNFKYDKQPLIFDEITAGAGTATHSADSRDVTLAVVDAANGSRAALCQHWYNVYTPGNSQFVILTGTLNNGNLAGGTTELFLRSNVTGTVTEVTADITAHANWQYSQIFVMDFQSLDVGRIRFALDADGLISEVGSIENDNRRATAYWQNPNLPMCYDAYNTTTESVTEFRYGDELNAVGFRFRAPVSASHSARAICATVKSEGGGDLLSLEGFPFRTPPMAGKTVSTTLIPLISLQVQSTFNSITNRSLVVPTTYSVQTDNPVDIVIVKNGTLTGASFAQISASSGVYYDTTASAITGGIQVDGDLFATGGARAGSSQSSISGKTPLSLNYAGTTGDILTFCGVRSTNTNAVVSLVAKYKEIR